MIASFEHSGGKPRDTANHFVVCTNRGEILIKRPPGGPLTPDQAFNLGIWLIALSDCNAADILRALQDIASKPK